jgi:hypothetical protein
MKTIPQLMSSIQKLTATIQAASADLQEVNNDLETIFGTSKVETAEAAPQQKQVRAPQRRQYQQRRKPVEVVATSEPVQTEVQALPPVYPNSRTMTAGEKNAIRAEWKALPKRERTPEKRAEFALRHRCSRIQIFALTRDDGHAQRISRIASQKKRLTGQPVNGQQVSA